AEALARGVVYYDDDNQPRATPLLLRPRVLGGNQRAYLHRVTRILEHAYMKLLALWEQVPAVREILPLTERETRWIRELHAPGHVEMFFGRFDASTDFGSHDWIKSTQFFEFNPLGAGGTYLAPTVEDIILHHVGPALRRVAPTLLLEPNDDPRRVLLEIMADHARHLRLKRFNLALCQYKGLDGGVDEFPRNIEFLRSLGIEAWHVDPRELRVERDELRYEDHPIDLIYRDHEINDLAAKEEAGDDLSGMRHALRKNRCVSSLAGEFDHKSVFEVFTTPEFAPHFSALERRVFRQHVPWTRRVVLHRTRAPDGTEVDLVPWLAKNRATMVLKPNRSYGGEGILLGRDVDDATFEEALERAVLTPGTWVAQAYSPVAEKDFPVIDEQGGIALAEYFSVLGLFASEQRLAILGRASRKKVVNVALDGGLVAVLRLL
ncbi:MAG TPA: hypothetical protein VM509_11050, partial [Planctomycetota bacterium]|nr:hypothetical protein [Planctomycetota bacterium]